MEVKGQSGLDEMVWWWYLGCQAPFTLVTLVVQLEPSGVNSPLAMLFLLDHSIKQKRHW